MFPAARLLLPALVSLFPAVFPTVTAAIPEPILPVLARPENPEVVRERLEKILGQPFPSLHAAVIVFLAPECPLSRAVVPALNLLAERYAADSIAFLGVLPRAASGLPEDAGIAAFRADHAVRFPLAGDPELAAARALNASVTPEAFLIDSAGIVRYRGPVDNRADALGQKRARATRSHLADALARWTRGEAVANPRVAAVGCFIE